MLGASPQARRPADVLCREGLRVSVQQTIDRVVRSGRVHTPVLGNQRPYLRQQFSVGHQGTCRQKGTAMFVDRDGNKKISGVYTCAQFDGQEKIADDHAEIAEFLAPKPKPVLTTAQKLSALGLTGAELKQHLGI